MTSAIFGGSWLVADPAVFNTSPLVFLFEASEQVIANALRMVGE